MPELLSVDTALEQILNGITALEPEHMELADSLGRVLAEDIDADIDIPPFPNSSMDGFAVHAVSLKGASAESPVQLTVVGDIPAGIVPNIQVEAGQAARIMTGAQMPVGADAVIPVESTNAVWTPGGSDPLPRKIEVFRSLRAGDYVRPAGEDMAIGTRILSAGRVLYPADIGVLAALGRSLIKVVRRPKVVILSTGDELVEVNEPLTPGKIRNTNSYTLAALVATYGAIPIRIPTARDTLEDVRRRFEEALDQQPDVILSSAGVSVGAFDAVRSVIEELGAITFWRVNLRPGKPLAFGNIRGVPFFGLPGNPVSAMVTFDVFVRPMLLRMGQRPETIHTITASVGEDIPSDGRRSYLRVKLSNQTGRWVATLTGTQSSGALSSMVQADGLLIIPEGHTQVNKGTELTVRLLTDLVSEPH
ncbi:MAG: molybdopterin molybdotransferase MoeA [Anaerolineae bacterium]|nr:molybdopterin molybdotransferase MoeA [Anaerolineae bacterium]